MQFRFPSPIYPIVDLGGKTPPTELAEAILSARIPFLQLRAKLAPSREFVEIARQLRTITRQHRARLIINDRPDVALLVEADGVHLGQDDLPVEVARQMLGSERIIGLSTHNAVQVADAQRSGSADYIAFGPIFPTRSKENADPVQSLRALQDARRMCQLPLVAIGGIDQHRLADVLRNGADTAALIGAIADAPDPHQAAADLLREARSGRSERGRVGSGES